MINQKRSPTSMIAWLLAIILIPYVAVPFYLIFGNRKVYKKKFTLPSTKDNQCEYQNATSMVLNNNGIRWPTNNNYIQLLTSGVDAYQKLIEQFNKAEHSLFISTYVLKNDTVTNQILSIMIKKAKQGVNVKLLIDCIGSWQLYFSRKSKNELLTPLKQAGGQVSFFMPIFKMPFRNYINLRNHRKIYLIDKHTVLTGGMNLACEYLGPYKDQNRWQDLLFFIQGEAACHYYNLFTKDWHYSYGERISQTFQVDRYYGKDKLQIVPSGPDTPGDALYQGILSGIYNAKKRIWIVTPYFIPSESLSEALLIAHRQGVEVKIITPKHSNHKIADLVRSSYMRTLMEAGIEIAFYEGGMLHAKAMLFDDDMAMLGSVNIDNRSLFLNYEVGMFAYESSVITDVKQWMNDLIAQSSYNMVPLTALRRFGENLTKVTAPLL
jgi:cardiolipin synthase